MARVNTIEVEIGQPLFTPLGDTLFEWVEEGGKPTPKILAGRVHPLPTRRREVSAQISGGAIDAEKFQGPKEGIEGPALSPSDIESILYRAQRSLIPPSHLVDRVVAIAAH